MKTKLISIKTLSFLLPLLMNNLTHAQNIVKNPSFEDGPVLCTPTPNQGPYGPGPFYLAEGYVNHWTGINPFKSNTYPMDTGMIFQNASTCLFAQFSPGISANHGNRAIGLFLERSATSNYDSRAIGEFTTGTIKQGTYKICLASVGYIYLNRLSRPEPNNTNTLQVFLVKEGTTIEKLISEFNIPSNISGTLPWINYGNSFKISEAEAETYDRVLLKLKPAKNNISDYSEGVYIDNLIIGLVNSTTSPCDGNYDLAAFDNDGDVGAEPYFPIAPNDDIWSGRDIWNRTTKNGLSITNENPGYSSDSKKYNVMRFRVRNIGLSPSQPSYAKLYWTMGATGETWDTNTSPVSPSSSSALNAWDGSKCIVNPSNNNCVVAGGELKGASNQFNPNAQAYVPGKGFPIPVLQPGEEYIIDAQWRPVDPAKYGKADIIKNPMICFLGRIVDSNDPMFGEYATDVSNNPQLHPFRNNIKNNNNVVTYNTETIALKSGEGFPGTIFVNNPGLEPKKVDVQIAEQMITGNPFNSIGGRFNLILDDILWDKWVNGGSSANGIEISNWDHHELLVTNSSIARLNNILLEPGEHRAIQLYFSLPAPTDVVNNYLYSVTQHLTESPDEEFGSVCNFLVSINAPQQEEGEEIYGNSSDGSVDTAPEAASVFGDEMKLYPNPTSDVTTLDFTLIQNTEVSIDILDTFGKTTKTVLSSEKLDKGRQSVKIDTSDLNMGIYRVIIHSSSENRLINLIKK